MKRRLLMLALLTSAIGVTALSVPTDSTKVPTDSTKVPTDSTKVSTDSTKVPTDTTKQVINGGYDGIFTDASGLKYGYHNGSDALTILSVNDSIITGDLIIPNYVTYDSISYVVRAIDDRAFAGNQHITSISIPSSVSSISHTAFYGCTGLNHITVDPSNKAFYSDSVGVLYELASDSVPMVYLITYPSASSATNYSILNGTVTLCNTSFYEVKNLQTLTIPTTVQNFCDMHGAFQYLGMASDMNGAFYRCPSLQSITVSDSSGYYRSLDGVLFNRDITSLLIYPAAKRDSSYAIPGTVTTVCSNAFSLASNLISITIPASVTSIGNQAFYGCTRLNDIHAGNTTPVNISGNDSTFNGADSCRLYVPAGYVEAYSSAEEWSNFTILEEKTAGISRPQGQPLTVSTASGTVTLSGMTVGETFQICDMTGRQVRNGKAVSSKVEISLPRGLYVVRCGNDTQKIMVLK